MTRKRIAAPVEPSRSYRTPDELNYRELLTIVQHVVEELYFDPVTQEMDPDREWAPDTLSNIAAIVGEHGLWTGHEDDLCKCGRHVADCATYDDEEADHGER